METDFFFKRIHSLTGLGLVLFLLLHFWTNSQVAWYVWLESGWFVRSVNDLNDLPFLPAVEIVLLAFPFLAHGYLGWKMSIRPRYLVLQGDGGEPSLDNIVSNRLYTWQRWSGLVLLVLVVWHVLEMRFWKRPIPFQLDWEGATVPHVVQLADRGEQLVSSLGEGFFLVLQEMFRNFWMSLLYTSFVLVASYHAARGVFTAGITWGVLVHPRQRDVWWVCSKFLFFLLVTFGMLAIWSIYFEEYV